MSTNCVAEKATIDILEKFVKLPGRACGFRIVDNGHRFQYAINDSTLFRAGSISKLIVGMAAESGSVGDFESKVSLGDLDLAGHRTIFNLFGPHQYFTIGELLSFAISLSDNVAANWLVDHLGPERIIETAQRSGIQISWDSFSAFPYKIQSKISVQGAFRILDEVARFERCHLAMRYSLNYSRIPLGIKSADINFYNKTASLTGLAHDIATLESHKGTMNLVFFSDNEPDTVITGLDMGVTTANLIEAWAFDVTRTFGY